MAERKGSALRRLLRSADSLSERAIAPGSSSVNTPCDKSRASLCSVTSADQRFAAIDRSLPARHNSIRAQRSQSYPHRCTRCAVAEISCRAIETNAVWYREVMASLKRTTQLASGAAALAAILAARRRSLAQRADAAFTTLAVLPSMRARRRG